MTSTARVPEAELTGLYGTLLKRFSSKMFGLVPDNLGVMWHNRPVLRTSLDLGRKASRWNACDANLKSYAHLAASSLIGCSFCLDYGYFQAHNDGLDVAKAREVPRWRQSDVFTDLERDVMAYAEAMSQTPPTVTVELSGRLLGQLGAPRWSSSPPGSGSPIRPRAATSRSVSRRRGSRRHVVWRLFHPVPAWRRPHERRTLSCPSQPSLHRSLPDAGGGRPRRGC